MTTRKSVRVTGPGKGREKPPMPANLEAAANAAVKRHALRSVGPGVSVAVQPDGEAAYVLTSPHRDTAAWEAMVCDALGTRSASTAQTFLYQLTDLCTPDWHPTEDGQGEWRPDERELNMILHMVAAPSLATSCRWLM